MSLEQKRISEMLSGFEEALTQNGWGYTTRLDCLQKANKIIKMHETKGLEYYDGSVAEELVREVEEQYYSGKFQKDRYKELLREIKRFVSFAETGEIIRKNPIKGSRYTLTEELEKIADNYLADSGLHPNTRNDARWVTHKYFDWLAKAGRENLDGVKAEHIQKFLLDCSSHMTQNSMYDVLLHLRKLYFYLYENGLSESGYETLLSFRVNRETKVYPPLPKETIVKIIAAIDRKTKCGKRNYAVMVLGAELGLRACDVTNLKLTDIDYIRGEIKIVQSKTAKTVVLPLTKTVGEALQDYILNGRLQSGEKQIFLRVKSPHTPLKFAVTVGEIYHDCCKAAGIASGKTFHSLRRSLGTSMINSGISINTAAQIFGDEKIDSMKQYISVDLSDVRELVSLLRRCSNNLNQIAKRANESHSIYEADIADLRRQYDTLWDSANGILQELAKI